MAQLVVVLRTILGLAFLVFGLNGFFHFLPPPEHGDAAQAYWNGLAGAEYFMPLLSGTKTAAGALLLLGRFVPLALVVLAPITVNIVLYHLALEPETGGPGYAVLGLHLVVAWAYRVHFRGVLRPAAKPFEGPPHH